MSNDMLKATILMTVEDLVGSFMYYDRKEDSELSRDDIEQAIKSGDITLDEIVDRFKTCLETYL